MNQQPQLVSVVIPAYNAENWLRRAVDSALAQTYPAVEVIIVDDGSTDGTRQVCEAYAGKIRYFFQQNRGVSAARNHGVANARGNIIVFLDADDELCPLAIELLAVPFLQNPSVGGCSGILMLKSASGRELLHPPKGSIYSGIIALYSFAQTHAISSATGVAVRKSYFEAVGGFTEGIHFGEDIELWNKIYGKYDWYFINEHIATYHRSPESSVTWRPVSEHGLNFIWTDRQMQQLVSPEKWQSFRQYRRAFLLSRARSAFLDGNRVFGKEALDRITNERLNLAYIKWILIYVLPESLWNGLRNVFMSWHASRNARRPDGNTSSTIV